MPFEPPIGTTFTSESDARLDDVIHIATHIIPFLQGQSIGPVRLRRYDDWLEHDGLHFAGPQIEFSDMFRLLESPRSLFEATTSDEHVCIGIGPESNRWYLRARAHWNSEDTELVGMISISMQPEIARLFREQTPTCISALLSEHESLSYFSSITG